MKIKQTVLIIALLVGLGGLFAPTIVSATDCAGVKTSVISCDSSSKAIGSCSDGTKPVNGACTSSKAKYTAPNDITKTGIWSLLLLAINILTAGVGIAAVGGIIFASIMYMTAGGSPDKTKKANIFLSNTILGIIVYAVMYAFLNYIIPGGLFS
jgi:hypothetical protein